jgi:NAD+ synthase (glutamine-hydrolysing)
LRVKEYTRHIKFMNIRVEQLNPVIGDIEGNVNQILAALKKAQNSGVDLLILPEMVLTGYPVQDLLENETFRNACYKANNSVIKNTDETALLFGSLTKNISGIGRKIFNSAILCQKGKMIGKVDKTLLPTYDIFDDLRYFEPNKNFECIEFQGVKLGVTICEDIWYNQNEVQYHYYKVNPAAELKNLGAQAIINISASPFTKNKHENRLHMLVKHARNLSLPIFYSNQTGVQTDVIFDGDSLVLDRKGNLITLTEPFKPGYADVSWDPETGHLFSKNGNPKIRRDKYSRILGAIKAGIHDYLNKTGIAGNLVLGLSGGIDSALVAVLAVEAVGKSNVTALSMPGEFSSQGSMDDAEKLAHNLGIKIHRVTINSIFDSFNETLKPLFSKTKFGVAEENLQSRIRGALLMAYSNKFGPILLTTGNKSELAVGYATLYGDMNGGLNPIGDLYKTEVFEFCEWLNKTYYQKEVIPQEIMDKPPSAELRPGQKDSDSLPEYHILDDILWRYIELQQDVEQIIDDGEHDENVVKKVIRLTDYSEFKRYQAPPVLKLSSKSFGSGRRWPIVQGWTDRKFNANNFFN